MFLCPAIPLPCHRPALPPPARLPSVCPTTAYPALLRTLPCNHTHVNTILDSFFRLSLSLCVCVCEQCSLKEPSGTDLRLLQRGCAPRGPAPWGEGGGSSACPPTPTTPCWEREWTPPWLWRNRCMSSSPFRSSQFYCGTLMGMQASRVQSPEYLASDRDALSSRGKCSCLLDYRPLDYYSWSISFC